MHERFDRDPRLGFPYLSYILKLEGLSLFHAGIPTTEKQSKDR